MKDESAEDLGIIQRAKALVQVLLIEDLYYLLLGVQLGFVIYELLDFMIFNCYFSLLS